MDGLITHTCSICKTEEANCLCKICNAWYCWEHHCHHLLVAHESNSYSERLDQEIEEQNEAYSTTKNQRYGQFDIAIPQKPVEQISNHLSGEYSISNSPKSIQSYSTPELQQQYDFHRSESRRIRAELERRALFASGVIPKTWSLDSLEKRERASRKQIRRSSNLPQSTSKAINILSSYLRQNLISVEYIKAQIKAAGKDN